MREEIARVEKLLEGILLLSEFRINASNMDIRPYNLCQLLHNSSQRFKQNLSTDQAARIELICSHDLTVEVNEQYFYFAFEHLLNNSIQYGDNSKITVTLDQVLLNDLKFASVFVKDKGHGISPSDAPHIFSPFYRGDGVGQSAIFGAGLGLTYAKEIINSFGGTLRLVESEEKGTIMEMRFLDISPS
ncbi:MAG: HAMP domain-containing sensor histidine kinase [Chloroflexota bacterium]